MANLAGVLEELQQERQAKLDQAIEVIGKLVGRNGTGRRARRVATETNTLRGSTEENSSSPESAMGKGAADKGEKCRVVEVQVD